MAAVRIALFVAMLYLCAAPGAAAQARLALLIGNQDYSAKVGPLKNPLKDIELVGAALTKLGFTVTKLGNVNKAQMDEAIRRYVDQVRRAGPGTVSFFYYSGHGAVNPDTNVNYLIPVDLDTADSDDLWYRSIEQQSLIDLLSQRAKSATHFVVFDACRNELNISGEAAKAIGADKGFVPVSDVSGILIAYATAQKRTAADSGEFARILSEELVRPGVEAFQVFREVQVRVKDAMRQEPWMSLNYIPRIYLAAPPAAAEPVAAVQTAKPQPALGEAAETWRQIKDSTDPALFEAFSKQYGGANPVYGALAVQKAAGLRRQQTAAAGPQAPAAPPLPAAPSPAATDNSKHLVRVFTGGMFRKAAFSPNGKHVLAGDVSGTLTLWDLTTGLEAHSFEAHKRTVDAIAFSADGEMVVSSSNEGDIKTWVTATGKAGTISSGLTVTSSAVLPDGRIIAAGCEKDADGSPICKNDRGLLRVFGAYGAVLSTIETGKRVTAFDISPDNNFAITCGDSLQLWELGTGRRLRTFYKLFCNSVKYSRDGLYVIAGGPWGSLKLFSTDPATGRELRSFSADEININSVALSPDGRFVLSASGGIVRGDMSAIKERRIVGKAVLWDASSGQKIITLEEIDDYISAVAFSPDGRFALSASDKNLKIWDVSEWTKAQEARR